MKPTSRIWIVASLVTAAVVVTVWFATRADVRHTVGGIILNQSIGTLSSEVVQTRFMSYAMSVSPLKRIELAKLTQIEVFERSSQAKLFWDQLALPEVVVRATVPVEYRYSADLNERWKVEFHDQVLTVIAPALEAGTPSPDISKLQFEVRKGSFFRNEAKVTEGLKSEITGLLAQRARESVPLVRETARGEIAALAAQWLSKENQAARVVVQFADEAASVP